MRERIADAQLLQLSDFIARHLGLHFPRERWLDLQSALCNAAEEYGWGHNVNRYVQELLSNQKLLKSLAGYLTVGETYFFREKRSLEVLENEIVPELIRSNRGRRIGIWSAGCATGEEPYSIAITLSKLMAAQENCAQENWDVEIIATDLNAKSLQKASAGVYGEWSFRGVRPWIRSAYFEPVEGERWAINPSTKKLVSFSQLNLMQDCFPSPAKGANGFDVIFCRNVLMYFTPEGMRKVVAQLYRSLGNRGWLIVSPTETSQELFSEFAAVDFGGVTLYRKSTTPRPKSWALHAVVDGQNRFEAQLVEERLGNSPLGNSGAALSPVCGTEDKRQDHEIGKGNANPPTPSYGEAQVVLAGQVLGAHPLPHSSDSQDLHRVARDHANQGKLEAALVCCDKAIAADKMAAPAYYLRATILQEQGFLAEAVFALKQAVYAEPQFVLGHFSLGNLALSGGDLKESEKHFENVLLLLAQYQPEDIVPESEGLSAGRLREIVASRLRGAPAIISRPGLSHRTSRRAGRPRVQQVERR